MNPPLWKRGDRGDSRKIGDIREGTSEDEGGVKERLKKICRQKK
jgi:hypothetical protein